MEVVSCRKLSARAATCRFRHASRLAHLCSGSRDNRKAWPTCVVYVVSRVAPTSTRDLRDNF